MQPQRNWFDIAALMPDSFPEPYAYGFLNNEWVLEALGAKVNYSINSNVVGMGKGEAFCMF